VSKDWRIRLASAPMEPTPERSWIAKADLDKARALLSRARQGIEPRQWEQLDRKLTAAERAFEHLLDAGADPEAPDDSRGPTRERLPPRDESNSQRWDAAFKLLGGAKGRNP